MNSLIKKLASSLAVLCLLNSGSLFAHQNAEKHSKKHVMDKKVVQKKVVATHPHPAMVKVKKEASVIASLEEPRAEKRWLLTSNGGLSYVRTDNLSHWLKISGVVRVDETFFMGNYRDKQSDFPSGSNLRAADIYLDGGIGYNWEYTLAMQFAGRRFSFSDVWVAYSGFMENNQVFVGRVPGQWFGLDNANSTSWNPFLERSLQANAFYPGDGLGVMTDFWWDNSAITLTAMQPDQRGQGDIVPPGVRDHWQGTVRVTLAPIHEYGNVWHFGISGAYRELVSTVEGFPSPSLIPPIPGGVAYATRPSARAKDTAALVNTVVGNNGLPIRANHVRLFNIEAARQCGSLLVEGEYTNAFVHRVGSSLGSLRFEGWSVQGRYLLTGEIHEYDVRDGGFGSLKPNRSYGAFEVAARYDFIDLNDKDVRGGSEHNVTVGLNWFVNQQVRLSANYIRAAIHPANDVSKRNLDIIGMRAQIRFK